MSGNDDTPETVVTETRRWFVKTGAAVTGGLALGASDAVAASDDTEQAGEPGQDADGEGGDGQGDGAYGLNEADVTFLQKMTAHHWGAVAMANLVPQRSNREPLVELAEQMLATQSDQIARMEAILDESDVSYQTEDVPESGDIPGMPSGDGMAALRTVDGTEFDLTFINLMSAHHRGAIVLANRVLEQGDSAEVAEMAREMMASQREQIYRLNEFYLDWETPPGAAE